METDKATIDPSSENLDCWALLEIFGHTKVAGRVSTRKVGVNVMIQVDVPNDGDGLSHSQLFGPSAIFSITPTSESWCRRWAKAAKAYERPVLPYIPAEPTAPRQIKGGDDDNPEESHQ